MTNTRTSQQGTNDTFAASAGHTLDFGGPEYQRRRGDHYNPPVRQILKPERSDKLQAKKKRSCVNMGTNNTFAASAGNTFDFGGPEHQRRRGDHYNPPVRQILKPERSDKLQAKKKEIVREHGHEPIAENVTRPRPRKANKEQTSSHERSSNEGYLPVTVSVQQWAVDKTRQHSEGCVHAQHDGTLGGT
nr:unnamed protein product [Callosobruchus analis]